MLKHPPPKVNCNVLTSKKTELAGCFYCLSYMQIFTIDNKSLVRIWDIKTGKPIKSFPLEISL